MVRVLDAAMRKLHTKSQVRCEAYSVNAARGWQGCSPLVLSLEHRLSGGGGMTQALEVGEAASGAHGLGRISACRRGGPTHQLLACSICKMLGRQW